MIKKISNVIKKKLKYLVVLICFYIIYRNFDANSDIILSLKKFSYINIIILFFCLGFMFYFYSILIYKTIIGTTSSKIKYFNWLIIFLNSQLLNVIPFLGFGYRAIKLKKYGLSIENYLGVYYLLTWLFFVFFFLMYGLEIAFFISPYFTIKKIPIVLLFFALAAIAAAAPFALIRFLPINLTIAYSFVNFAYSKMKNIIYRGTLSVKNKNYIKNFLLFAFLAHLFEFFIIWIVIEGFGLSLALKWIVLFFIIGNITDLFQITPGNLGISELTLGIAGIPLGLDFSTGVVIRLFVRIVNLAFLTLLVLLANLTISLFFPKIKI